LPGAGCWRSPTVRGYPRDNKKVDNTDLKLYDECVMRKANLKKSRPLPVKKTKVFLMTAGWGLFI